MYVNIRYLKSDENSSALIFVVVNLILSLRSSSVHRLRDVSTLRLNIIELLMMKAFRAYDNHQANIFKLL